MNASPPELISVSDDDLEFGAFCFHSRWFLLVTAIAIAASFVGDFLGEAVLFGYAVFVVTRNNLSVGGLVGRWPSDYSWGPLVFLAVGGLLYSFGAITILVYPLYHLDSEWVTALLETELFPDSPLKLFVMAVILAPLLEEIIFRGLIFSRLTKKWGMTWGMIVSSLAFAVLHLDPIGAFVFGVTTCVLYVRTKTLLVPMALHALNNLIVWVVSISDESGPVDSELITQLAYVGLLCMTLGAPIVFTLLGRWWPSKGTPLPYDENMAGGNHPD